MQWEFIAPMAVMLTLILTTGGVLVVRPLTKRLGELLHVMAQQRRVAPPEHEVAQLRELVGSLEARLTLLEERQNFTESLLTVDHRRHGVLAPPASPRDPAAYAPRSTGSPE